MPLPKPFNFPKPPRLSNIAKGANPLHEVIDDARSLIQSGKDSISDIASALRVEGQAPPKPEEEVVETEIKEDQIKGGTAGNICSDEHVSQAASDLAEGLRMAQSRGVKDGEVRERLKKARAELNEMERYDLVAEKVVGYPPEQQKIARWLLPRSSTMRHTINEILMRDSEIDDLENLSAYASTTASELTDRIDSLPADQKASDECLEVKSLKTFLEERKLKKGGK